MASPYGNSAVYRGAQRRANMIQNRETPQQEDPLRQSIMGTPLEEQPQEPAFEAPVQPEGPQFSLKPYSDKGQIKQPRPTSSGSPAGLGSDLFNRGSVAPTSKPYSGGDPMSRFGSARQGMPSSAANAAAMFGSGSQHLNRAYSPQQPEEGQEPQGNADLLASILPPAQQESTPPTQTVDELLPQLTPQQDKSQWNTEGWATPEYTGKAAGGPMAGWDGTNWDDPNMQTPKYVVGRILSNYTPSMEGLGQAMEEIQKAYPGAEFDGKDKIIVPGLGTIDVLVNAGGDNMSWAWQDLTNDPGTSPELASSIVGGSKATDPTSALLGGLDPSVLNDPAWRELLAGLGIKI